LNPLDPDFCEVCDPTCSKCDGSATTCTECRQHPVSKRDLLLDDGRCVETCPAGTVPDLATHKCISHPILEDSSPSVSIYLICCLLTIIIGLLLVLADKFRKDTSAILAKDMFSFKFTNFCAGVLFFLSTVKLLSQIIESYTQSSLDEEFTDKAKLLGG